MSAIIKPADAAGDPAQPDGDETGTDSAEHQNQSGPAGIGYGLTDVCDN
jgi:hypothetical protein